MPRPRIVRRLRSALPVALVLASAVPVFGGGSAAADPIDDQRERVEDLTDQLQQLERDADIYGERYNVALIEQQDLAEEIDAAESSISDKEAKVDELRKGLADVAAEAFVGSGSGNLGPLFQTADDVRVTEQRAQYSRVALNVGTVTTDDLEAAIDDLDAEKADLQDKKDEAEQLADQAAAAKEQAEESKAEYQQQRVEAEAELGDLIREEEERRAREAYEAMLAEQARQQAELEAQQEAEAQRLEQERQEQLAEQQTQAEAAEATEAEATEVAAVEETTTEPPAPTSDDSDDDGSGGSPPAPWSPPPAEPDPPVVQGPSSKAQIAINAALSEIGTPWQYAMAQPGVGFDCSGLTSWAWAQAGVSMPHQSAQQYASLPHVPVSQAQPGDLLFYYSPISHVGIYLGNGQLVHSPNSSTTVKVASVSWENVVGAARPG